MTADRGAEAGADEARLDRRLDRLEQIVERLDSPDLELEDALQLFEEGIRHLRAAREVIRTSETRIERLLENEAGEGVLEPMDDAP